MALNAYCREIPADALVTLRTDKVEYAVGEELTLTITNNSAKPIHHYGICSLTICEHGVRGWFCSEKDCYAPKETILPGESIEFRDKVNTPYKKGALGTQRYKFEYQVDSKPGISTAFSNEYVIKG